MSQRRVSDLMVFRRESPFDKVITFSEVERPENNVLLERKIKTLEDTLLESKFGISDD